MRGAVLYGPGDIRFEERDAPTIIDPLTRSSGLPLPVCSDPTCGPMGGVAPITRRTPMGQVFDLTLPLDQVAEGYRAMDGRASAPRLRDDLLP